MPIYIDHHKELQFVTAESVAQLLQKDLKIQHEFNCRGLIYWFDTIGKTAFCLIEAPDKESVRKLHKYAHEDVPNKIIEIDSTVLQSFLERMIDLEKFSQSELDSIKNPAQRTLMAIQVTPITLLNTPISQSEINTEQSIFTFGDLLKHFQGRFIEQTGFHSIIAFDTLYKAVLCAFEFEKAFNSEQASLGVSDSKLKIGLATSLPNNHDKRLIADTLKVADYLCFVEGHTIVVSNEVKRMFLIENYDEFFLTKKLNSLSLANEIFLIKLMGFVEKEWQNAYLKVEDFSAFLGISKTMLYRKMIFLTGKSPSEFLKEYRLNRALNEINQNLKNLSEIAFESGFNSPSYFSKCFKKRYGLLPSDYIKS